MANSIAAGASFSIAWRWIDRLIGLASIPVLARVLAPEDFGLVAMAMLVVGLIDVVFDLGVNVALIQNRGATAAHFDTAWTLRLMQGAAVGLVVAVAAWPASAYFSEPRLIPVMLVIALTSSLAGLENIGIVMLQKNFEFAREFRYFVWRRLASFVGTVVLALVLRDHWALVLGALAGRVAAVALSYALHEFRPRLSLVHVREILGVSQWLLVRGMAGYVLMKLDQFVLGRFGGAASLGTYSVGAELAAMPATELLAPLSRVLFPTFVAVQNNAASLARVLRLGIAVQSLVALPASVGLALVAPEAVAILLGERWQASVPVVQMLALLGLLSPLGYTSSYAMLAEGRVRMLTGLIVVQIAMFVALCALIYPGITSESMAATRLGTSAAMTIIATFAWLRPGTPIGWRDIATCMWRPAVSTSMMTAAVAFAGSMGMTTAGNALAVKVIIGAVVYTAAGTMLWFASGRPEGAESYLIEVMSRLRLRNRS